MFTRRLVLFLVCLIWVPGQFFAQVKVAQIAGSPGSFTAVTGLVLTSAGDLGYVANPGSGLVQKFRASTGDMLATLSLPPGLGAAALSPDERTLAVLGIANQRIYIIDPATLTVLKETGYANSGFTTQNNILFTTDNRKLLISDASQNFCSASADCFSSVAVINVFDGSLDRIIGLNPDGINATALFPVPHTSHVGVLCVGAHPGDPQGLYILDANGLGLTDWVSLSGNNLSPSLVNNLQATTGKILIPSYNDDRIAVYDTKTFALFTRLTIGKGPSKMVVSPNGRFAAVAFIKSKNVQLFNLPETLPYDVPGLKGGVLDLPGLEVTGDTVPVFSSDSNTLFIPSPTTNDIIAYDISALGVRKRIPVGRAPTLLTLSPDGSVMASLDLGSNLLSLMAMTPKILFLPHLVQSGTDYSGLALANFDSQSAAVALTARNNAGALLPGTTNPRFLIIPPSHQVALQAGEIFGFAPGGQIDGYIEAYTTSTGMTLLYLTGNYAQTRLDGFIADSSAGKLLGFSRITEGMSRFGSTTSTEIMLENPSYERASVQLTLYAQTLIGPGSLIKYMEVSLGPWERIRAPISTLMPSSFYPLENAYLEVNSNVPLKGLESIHIGDSFAMIPADTRSDTATSFFAVQFASGGAAQLGTPIYSNLSLVNTDANNSITVTAKLIGNDGKLIPAGSKPVVRTIRPYEALSGGADAFFGFPDPLTDPDVHVGTLELSADRPGLIADLLYGDARDGRYLTGINLHGEKGTSFTLGHMAQGSFGDGLGRKELFTGIAIYNPNPGYANILIEPFAPSGEALGKAAIRLDPRTRMSKTIAEIIPSLTQQGGGTVRLSSDLPVYLFEVFGSMTSDFLVAVPPTILAR